MGVPAAPPGAVGPRPRPRLRPSWVWYVVAGAVALAGVGVSVVLIVLGALRFVGEVDDLQRVVMPGRATLELDEGSYTIYYEYLSEVGGRPFDTPVVPPDLRFTLIGPDGTQVPLALYDGSFTYSDADRAGSAQLTFRAPTSGEYVLTGVDVTERSPDVVIAVGPGLAGTLVRAVLVGLVVGALCEVVALVILVVTVVRRSKSKRLLDAQHPPSGWPPPPGTGYGTWAGGQPAWAAPSPVAPPPGWSPPPSPPSPPSPSPPGPGPGPGTGAPSPDDPGWAAPR
ncbi:MAG: hypothetical protein IPM45_04660 [Acidimicrobiales bacterium]|nr:hypothetical protein [Acidimicrobiales bacterium]